MKNILIYLCLLFMSSVALADIILDNKTDYPEKAKSKIAVQWAESGESIQKENKSILNNSILDESSLKILKQNGLIKITPPNKAKYFRIVVWSTDKKIPDFLTSWVDIVPTKTYIVNQDLLIPAVLMSGSGC